MDLIKGINLFFVANIFRTEDSHKIVKYLQYCPEVNRQSQLLFQLDIWSEFQLEFFNNYRRSSHFICFLPRVDLPANESRWLQKFSRILQEVGKQRIRILQKKAYFKKADDHRFLLEFFRNSEPEIRSEKQLTLHNIK